MPSSELSAQCAQNLPHGSGFEVSDFGWIAWVLAILAWLATYYTNRRLQKKLEIHRMMDKLSDQVERTEDLALDYWVRQSTSVDYAHLTISIKRATNLAVKLHKLDHSIPIPQASIVKFRKAITGRDPRLRPLTSTGIQEILSASSDLQQHYEKSF